jgi:hypothetical protein
LISVAAYASSILFYTKAGSREGVYVGKICHSHLVFFFIHSYPFKPRSFDGDPARANFVHEILKFHAARFGTLGSLDMIYIVRAIAFNTLDAHRVCVTGVGI